MGVVIEHSAVAAAASGSVDHAVAAGRECLERAGIAPGDIDVLINVGVYRDQNIVEPANSALIQQGLGIHPDYQAGSGRSTFSFDLRNGSCGILDAVHAATALLSTGTAERVLIVASDAHPGGPDADNADFPYATGGAAWLLRKSVDHGVGFGAIDISPARGNAPGTHAGVTGYLDLKGMGTSGQRTITVDVLDDYAASITTVAADTLRGYLAANPEIDPAATVLVTNNPTPSLAVDLAGSFGFAQGFQAVTDGRDGGSAALAIAYHRWRQQDSVPGTEVLLLAAGSGPMAACASYRSRTDGTV